MIHLFYVHGLIEKKNIKIWNRHNLAALNLFLQKKQRQKLLLPGRNSLLALPVKIYEFHKVFLFATLPVPRRTNLVKIKNAGSIFCGNTYMYNFVFILQPSRISIEYVRVQTFC